MTTQEEEVDAREEAADNAPCSCGNCDWEGPMINTEPVKDLNQRLDCGITIVPIGECPECGALAYRDDTHDKWKMEQAQLSFFPALLDVAMETTQLPHRPTCPASTLMGMMSAGEVAQCTCWVRKAHETIRAYTDAVTSGVMNTVIHPSLVAEVVEALDNTAAALETVLIHDSDDKLMPVEDYRNRMDLVDRAKALVERARPTDTAAKRYNTMFDVAFTVEHGCEDVGDVPVELIMKGLEKRLCALKELEMGERGEAFGHSDTYEIEE